MSVILGISKSSRHRILNCLGSGGINDGKCDTEIQRHWNIELFVSENVRKILTDRNISLGTNRLRGNLKQKICGSINKYRNTKNRKCKQQGSLKK